MKWVAQELGTSILAGTHAVHVGNGTISQFNSAILLDRSGQLVGRYDKMHPVMFGEYVPFGRWIPRLYRLSPLQGGLTAGREAVAFSVGGWKMAPSICFENTVPHLIRRQVAQLEAMGESPDLLVTITNDGWFWGSSLLDVHLTSAVFRAVETRRTMLVAANTGFSAWIDGNGQVLAKGPRRDTEVLIAKVHRDGRTSPYVAWGDWFAGLCFAFCLAAIAGISGKSVRSLSRIRNAVRTLVDQDHRTSGFSRP
jgi:apolipoprotein N-acyltransferase